ncbi:MAG: DUF2190 family protein [Planctomycetes bacterium]|nr:DUF2190 family protein [Planctomycetota bacterium]
MKARFVQQGVTVDYIPAAEVKAGAIVVVNDLLGVSRYDIKAGDLGSLAVAPAPVFEVEKGASVAFAYGQKVYWDTANAKVADAAGTGVIFLGLCVSTAGSLASDPLCRVRLAAA